MVSRDLRVIVAPAREIDCLVASGTSRAKPVAVYVRFAPKADIRAKPGKDLKPSSDFVPSKQLDLGPIDLFFRILETSA